PLLFLVWCHNNRPPN
ncbi:ABC-type phosphate/phosphonate transport system, periplasmic component domain protein, partial [Vibrio parahaemolyticus V-223/04]